MRPTQHLTLYNNHLAIQWSVINTAITIMNNKPDLPLTWATPDAWADAVLSDPLALLNDHAHLEKKAARNALELLDRWPDPHPPEHWIQTMTAVAKDEVDHLATVTRLLRRRHGQMSKHHVNPYANALRKLVRMGLGPIELMDRLMVSALIEARSCERFEILSRRSNDDVLKKLYTELWQSEHGHYLVFLEMANNLVAAEDVEQRWAEMLESEAEIISSQSPGPRMHSGIGSPLN